MRDLPFRVTPNAQRPLLPAVGSQGVDLVGVNALSLPAILWWRDEPPIG